MINYFAIPAAFALAVKIWLIWSASRSLSTHNKLLAITLLSLAICNLIELSGFTYANIPNAFIGLIGLKLYYVFLILSGVSLLALSLNISQIKVKIDYYVVILTALFISLIPFLSDLYIKDYKSIGYAITRVPGEYYVMAQVQLFLAFFSPSAVLAYGAYKKKIERCRLLFLTSLPMVTVIIISIPLMMLDKPINLAMYFSMTTSIMVVSLIYTESKKARWHLLSALPFTKERKQQDMILDLFLAPQSLKDAEQALSLALIKRTLENVNNNKTEAARHLGISAKTLRNRLEKENLTEKQPNN